MPERALWFILVGLCLKNGVFYAAKNLWQHKYAILAAGRDRMPGTRTASFAQMVLPKNC